MDATTLQKDPANIARLEAHALERMARASCEHSRQLLAAARERGALGSREASFQVEVFAERCAQAGELLRGPEAPVKESRIARLEKLVDALECSRGYFRGLAQSPSALPRASVRRWQVGMIPEHVRFLLHLVERTIERRGTVGRQPEHAADVDRTMVG